MEKKLNDSIKNSYTLSAKDYQVLYEQILKHQLKNDGWSFPDEVKAAHTAIFVLIKSEIDDFKKLSYLLNNKKYDEIPLKKMENTGDFSRWPYLNNYELQKSIYHHFKKNG